MPINCSNYVTMIQGHVTVTWSLCVWQSHDHHMLHSPTQNLLLQLPSADPPDLNTNTQTEDMMSRQSQWSVPWRMGIHTYIHTYIRTYTLCTQSYTYIRSVHTMSPVYTYKWYKSIFSSQKICSIKYIRISMVFIIGIVKFRLYVHTLCGVIFW